MSIGPPSILAVATSSQSNANRRQSNANTQRSSGGVSQSGGASAPTGAVNRTTVAQSTWKQCMERIQQRKQKVCSLPMAQKLAKLSMYSGCQAEGCRCTGWKISLENRDKDVESSYCPDFKEKCCNISCRHSLQSHIAHVDGISGTEINKLLIAIIDMEKLYASMQGSDDEGTKKVYLHVVRLLRHCVITRQPIVIRGPLGEPPFSTPCIAKAVASFVFYKYKHLSRSEVITKSGVAKTFLNFLNYYKFQPPSKRIADLNNVDATNYGTNYSRWLVFCRLPTYYHSLRRYETIMVFGREFLVADFQNMARELKVKCIAERNIFPADKSIITQMPTFLEAFEEEMLKQDSPIWDQSYGPQIDTNLQQRKRQQDTVGMAASDNVDSSTSSNGSDEPARKMAKRVLQNE